jgi:transcription elongation factor Elf1
MAKIVTLPPPPPEPASIEAWQISPKLLGYTITCSKCQAAFEIEQVDIDMNIKTMAEFLSKTEMNRAKEYTMTCPSCGKTIFFNDPPMIPPIPDRYKEYIPWLVWFLIFVGGLGWLFS